ncbi:MAG: hypothetical protein ABII06_05800, partial [Pseudomonadota bacterium]
LLAGEGFTCVDDILEGHDGFFKALKGAVNEEAVASLGRSWEAENLAQKYHASCHATHSPIEAVLGIAGREKLAVSDIKSITLNASEGAIAIAGKLEPGTGLEGKFSIPYCVANALVTGNTTVPAFTDERVNKSEVRELMKKISLVLDPGMTGLESRVEVETTTGHAFEGFSDVMNEIPGLEEKRGKVKIKFMDLCSPILGEERSRTLMDKILSLEEEKNLNTLIELVH